MMLFLLWCCSSPGAIAQDPDSPPVAQSTPVNLPRDTDGLIALLVDQKRGSEAVAALVAKGPKVVPALGEAAANAPDILARGHAIQALAGIKGDEASSALRALTGASDQSEMVRTWAGAALVARAGTLDDVLALAPLSKDLAGMKEPLRKRVVAYAGELDDLRGALTLSVGSPEVQQALLPAIQSKGVKVLMVEVLTHPEQDARRMAAGILAGMKNATASDRKAVIAAYGPNAKADKPPWTGGALYVPSMGYARDEARTIAGHLVAWYAWCDGKGLDSEKQQVFNNLMSVGIWRQAGFGSGPPYNSSGSDMKSWFEKETQ